MKVYRGFNKDIGPISYNDWIYVTPDLEQAKWYASRDGQIKNGEVIEYEISDKLNFLSIDDVNNIMFNEDEEYSIEDLLWYQEGLSDYLYEYGAGIEFEDPKFKNHIIYILFDKKYLKNGKIMKNNLNEAYIKAEKGNIYYTKNSDMFLSMVKSIFISNNKAVRVYYDINKGLYVFGDAFNYIHADLANGMKYHSNIYGPDEMRANVSYLRENCALFQVLPDDDFKKYDVGDGYTDGWFLKIDDLIFACRNKQYHKLRDEVPLFKDYIGYWMPTDYYIAKKQGLTESVEEKIIAYHGSQHKKFNFRDDKVLYLTTDKKKAESYAKREWDEGLIEGEIPVVYTFEVSVKNPYVCHTENEFQCEFCDVNMNLEGGKEELIEKGYDSIKYKDLIGVFSSSQIKLVDTEVLPPSMDYYYPKDTKDGDEDINDYYYDGEEKLNESVEDKILYIIRGVPGSGKSTLAHKLTDNVVEADQYFYDDKGNYNWSADKLNQAHNWCFYTVKKYMEEGRDKIAVANTFIKNRDYKRYVELAKEFGYNVDIRTCTGNYQNIHNVPDETVEKMRNKFQETPLDESIAYASKKDLSDIILKNPTRKELKEYKINNWRILQDIQGNYYFADAMKYIHQQMSNKLNSKGIEAIDAETDNAGIISYNILTNTFYYRLLDLLDEKDIEKEYNNSYLSKEFSNAELLQSNDDIEELDESAENDKTLRDYAVKLANICLDALVKTKYETKISKEQVQINVDKAFKKAVPMLKNSPYEYFIILVSKNNELYASYGKTVDRKYGLITLPVFSKDPIDQTLSILYKHKSLLNKLYSTYSGDELKLKINEYAIKYLKKELEKSLSNVKSEYLDLLIHECTHLLDDVRRTKTYNKSKEQNLKDDKGIETYYNSPEEQNAYYQETVSIFDEYAENKLVGYKTFDIFWDDFIRQYRGEYNMLNDKNKRKLKKRAYTYWYVYMKD